MPRLSRYASVTIAVAVMKPAPSTLSLAAQTIANTASTSRKTTSSAFAGRGKRRPGPGVRTVQLEGGGSAVASVGALVLLVRFERATLWELNASSAAATVLVSVVVRFGGDAAPSYRFFYLWVLVYSALFYRRGQLALQLVLVAAGYAL